MAMGTQLLTLKRASFASLFRFANLTGIVVPETFAGVGDLPVGAYQVTLGYELPGDNMAAVFKSKVCLVWCCNPAATRIPDAHFFWEARYNGTEVVTITPDFNASAMHSSKLAEPETRDGRRAGLRWRRSSSTIGATIDWDYVREQTDLPFLVRTDNRKFLRQADIDGQAPDGDGLSITGTRRTGRLAPVPATGRGAPAWMGPPPDNGDSIELGDAQAGARGHGGRWRPADGPGRSNDRLRAHEEAPAELHAGTDADRHRRARRRRPRGRDASSRRPSPA